MERREIVERNLANVEEVLKTNSTAKVGGGSYGFAEGSLSHQMPVTDGSRPNSDRSDGALAMNWNRDNKDGSGYEVSGRYYQAEYGSPGPTDNLTPDARQEYRKSSLDSKYHGAIGETGTVAATLYGDSISLEDRSQPGLKSTLSARKAGLKADTTWSRESGPGRGAHPVL